LCEFLFVAMQWKWWNLLAVACVAHALCTPGKDGRDCTVTVENVNSTCSRVTFNTEQPLELCNGRDAPLPEITVPAPQCKSIIWPGLEPLTVCNQTGQLLLLEDAGPECFKLTAGGQSRTVCNGTQGAAGTAGVGGIQPSVQPAGPGCLRITGSDGSGVFCNSTQIPNVIVVDGTTYALSRAGITAAMQAAYNPNGMGATVLVAGDVVHDGVANIKQMDRVTLDFQGHTLAMPPGNTQIVLIGSNGGDPGRGTTLGAYEVVGNVSAGIQCFSLTTAPTGIEWGSFAFISGFVVEISATGGYYDFVSIITNITGSLVCLHDSAPYDMKLTNQFPVRFTVKSCTDRFTFRNAVLNLNGNTGNSLFAFAQFCTRCTWENIDIVGRSISTDSKAMLHLEYGYANRFINIRSTNASVPNAAAQIGFSSRDIGFLRQSHAYIENILSVNFGGFGPALQFSHFCIWNGLQSVRAHARGFRVDSSTRNHFSNIVINGAVGAAGTGLRIAFGSQYNTFSNMVIRDCDDYGLVFEGQTGGISDSYNTVNGLVSINNGAARDSPSTCKGNGWSGDLYFAHPVIGNVVRGRVGCTPTAIDANANQFISETSNGLPHLSWTLVNTGSSAPGVQDFSGMPQEVLLTLNGNSQLRISVRGSDNTIRSVLLTLT
jgi:hypothetical protein